MNELDQIPKETNKEIDKVDDDHSNENAGILVDDFLKISDPNSGKVYVAKRGNS